MTTAAIRSSRRPPLVAVCLLVLLLTGCTARGGGQLSPSVGFTGSASFGFSFSCEDKGGINRQTGQLRIQLSYTERSTQSLLPLPSSSLLSPFSIHGVVDELDPVVESMICSGQEPLLDGNELIFLGRYRVTSTSAGFPSACAAEITTSSCRFEVIVRDNDRTATPTTGDWFSIKLSSVTSTTSSSPEECPLDASLPCNVTQFSDASVLYTRAGLLSSGNLTVE